MSSGKLFQTAGAACEKARSAKARLVRSSCSRFLPQDRSWREAARNLMMLARSLHILLWDPAKPRTDTNYSGHNNKHICFQKYITSNYIYYKSSVRATFYHLTHSQLLIITVFDDWRIFLDQSFTAHMPLLTALGAFRLERRH